MPAVMAHNPPGSPLYQQSSNPSSISGGFTPSTTSTTFIEADSEHGSDDMASIISSTMSANEDIFNYVKENGRTYHAYQAGSYLLPNDDVENERLDLQHEVLKLISGRRLHLSPLLSPQRVLDIGTGTGKWAIEMDFPRQRAESTWTDTVMPYFSLPATFEDDRPYLGLRHRFYMETSCRPYSETHLCIAPGQCSTIAVTGTDLSPIQPQWVPDNVKFVIDDASEEDWIVPPNHYDFIHSRMMLGSFTDFRDIVRRAYRYTKPGGFFECQELWPPILCDDDTMPEDHPLSDWIRRQDAAAMQLGRPVRIANKLKRWLEQQGFVDVREEVVKVPINTWPRDAQYKLIGKFWEAAILDGLQGFSLAHFTRGLGWTKDELEVYLVRVRKAITDRSVHCYQKVYTVWGRKPDDPSRDDH